MLSCGEVHGDVGLEPTSHTPLIQGDEVLVTTSEVGVDVDVLRRVPSRTMLAQEGATQESLGLAGNVGPCCWVPSSLAGWLPSPFEGEAGGGTH